MSKVAFFGHISPNFLTTFFFRNPPNFLGNPKTFYPPKNFRPPQIFFTLLDLKVLFLDFIQLKKSFFSPEKTSFFRPKKFFLDLKIFLDFLDLKTHF